MSVKGYKTRAREKRVKRDGLFTWRGTRMVKGKKWSVGKEGKRKGEAKEIIMAVLGQPAKQPCSWATVPGVGEKSHRSSDQTSCQTSCKSNRSWAALGRALPAGWMGSSFLCAQHRYNLSCSLPSGFSALQPHPLQPKLPSNSSTSPAFFCCEKQVQECIPPCWGMEHL